MTQARGLQGTVEVTASGLVGLPSTSPGRSGVRVNTQSVAAGINELIPPPPGKIMWPCHHGTSCSFHSRYGCFEVPQAGKYEPAVATG